MSGKQQFSSDEPRKVVKKEGFARFLYNSDTKEFLGRTGKSWALIGLFYLVFYAFLAAFFAIMLAVFLQTLDSREPKWQLGASRIGTNPGMGVIPKPKSDNVDSTLIWFTHGTEGNWQHWAESIKNFTEVSRRKGDSTDGNADICAPGSKRPDGQSCHLDISRVINSSVCTEQEQYGYRYGQPCVIVKLNKIFGWVPEPYDKDDLPDDMPQTLKDKFDSNYIGVSCEGENAADKENIGQMNYFPSAGLPNNFYPFNNQEKYEVPFVFVHFTNPTKGVLINIECRAWAKNIQVNRAERLGGVHFELLID
ncbi:Sodium/potassium-transporting ATPase subunit beta-2 [Nymphon striatum]|nr:Sodium/potassium-transporting ATPase subunit beta-2 [Nymphon striatum]